MQELLWK